MTRTTLRVGTRASLLATTQTRKFVQELQERFPELEIHEITIQTLGDISTEPLSNSKTPGLFVSALRDALLRDEVDFIVHSMKDLPAQEHPQITTACVPLREDSRDGLVSRDNLTLEALPTGAVVGTSSPRRSAILRKVRPDLHLKDIRGNIDTRIAKVQRGEYDATILAAAGLNRVGRSSEFAEIFPQESSVPAPGQGALSVECRADDTVLAQMLHVLDDATARLTTAAERSVLVGLKAGCSTAIGAYATHESGELRLIAELGNAETGDFERVELVEEVALGRTEQATAMGINAAKMLLRSEIASKASFE